jgi:hypothetical protein
MAVILPANTIGQTWFPQLVSVLREHYGNYGTPMAWVFTLSIVGAIAIAILPRHRPDPHVPASLPEAQQSSV